MEFAHSYGTAWSRQFMPLNWTFLNKCYASKHSSFFSERIKVQMDDIPWLKEYKIETTFSLYVSITSALDKFWIEMKWLMKAEILRNRATVHNEKH